MTNQTNAPRYGGRALRNGVMMMGPHSMAVAVRQPDGRITTAVEPIDPWGEWSRNIPFVRGLVAFAGMMKLARGAGRLEGKLNGGSKWRALMPQLAPGVGVAIAERLTSELSKRSDTRMVMPIEAVGGVALPFLAFGLSGKLPGVRELWRYHGAEHKAVNNAESDLDLTALNAATMSRVHPRCGTVLAFWGLLGGFLTRSHVSRLPNGPRKSITSAIAGPLVLSTAYELVRLGARYRHHPIGAAVFGPSWQTQRLTTAEPGPEELEVAVAALQAVIDFEEELIQAQAA